MAQARLARGMSVREMAAKLGIDHSYLLRIEQGRAKPSKRVLAGYLNVLELADDFVGADDTTTTSPLPNKIDIDHELTISLLHDGLVRVGVRRRVTVRRGQFQQLHMFDTRGFPKPGFARLYHCGGSFLAVEQHDGYMILMDIGGPVTSGQVHECEIAIMLEYSGHLSMFTKSADDSVRRARMRVFTEHFGPELQIRVLDGVAHWLDLNEESYPLWVPSSPNFYVRDFTKLVPGLSYGGLWRPSGQ